MLSAFGFSLPDQGEAVLQDSLLGTSCLDLQLLRTEGHYREVGGGMTRGGARGSTPASPPPRPARISSIVRTSPSRYWSRAMLSARDRVASLCITREERTPIRARASSSSVTPSASRLQLGDQHVQRLLAPLRAWCPRRPMIAPSPRTVVRHGTDAVAEAALLPHFREEARGHPAGEHFHRHPHVVVLADDPAAPRGTSPRSAPGSSPAGCAGTGCAPRYRFRGGRRRRLPSPRNTRGWLSEQPAQVKRPPRPGSRRCGR